MEVTEQWEVIYDPGHPKHSKIIHDLAVCYDAHEYIDTANAIALYGYTFGYEDCRSFVACEHLRHRYKFWNDDDPLVDELMLDKYKPIFDAAYGKVDGKTLGSIAEPIRVLFSDQLKKSGAIKIKRG